MAPLSDERHQFLGPDLGECGSILIPNALTDHLMLQLACTVFRAFSWTTNSNFLLTSPESVYCPSSTGFFCSSSSSASLPSASSSVSHDDPACSSSSSSPSSQEYAVSRSSSQFSSTSLSSSQFSSSPQLSAGNQHIYPPLALPPIT